MVNPVENNSNRIKSVLYAFQDSEYRINPDATYYMSGGCGEFAVSAGTALEESGFNVEYFEYGSDGEPGVHFCLKVDQIFFDYANLAHTAETLSSMADFYTDTLCSWKRIKKLDILSNPCEVIYEKLLNLTK